MPGYRFADQADYIKWSISFKTVITRVNDNYYLILSKPTGKSYQLSPHKYIKCSDVSLNYALFSIKFTLFYIRKCSSRFFSEFKYNVFKLI